MLYARGIFIEKYLDVFKNALEEIFQE